MKTAAQSWQLFLRSVWRRPAPQASRDARRQFRVPRLERLEDRLAPAAHDTLATAFALPPFDANQQVQLSGTLTDPNQVDLYRVPLNSGDEVTAQVQAYSLSNPLDSGLRIFDSNGHQLAFNDNQDGFDPRLIFTASSGSVYYVGVSSARDFSYDPLISGSGAAGNSTGTYTLSVARSPFAESEANASVTGLNDTSPTADVINANAHVHGTIGVNDRDYFRFTVTGTGRLTAAVTPSDGRVLLPRLALYDDSGQLLIQSDARDSGHPSAQLIQHLKPGTYYLAVSAVSAAPGGAGDRGYVLDAVFDPALPLFQSLPVGKTPETVAVGDVNGDGIPDLATANYGDSTVSVLLGLGNGSFQSTAPLPVGEPSVTKGPWSVTVADVTGDGIPDLTTANLYDSTVSVLPGQGDGTFLPAISYPLKEGSFPWAEAVGDFNHDDHLDLVTTDTGDGTVSVLLSQHLPGQKDWTFQSAVSYDVGSSPQAVAVGDFNHDGNLDLAVANTGNAGSATSPVYTVSVLLGRPNGTFQTAVSYVVGSQPYGVAVGDFNHDGNLDLATANYGDGTVSVLLGRKDGTFLPAVSLSVGSQPASVVVEDFNQDGHLDLATANFYGNTVSVLLGRGDGTFQTATPVSVGAGPVSVAVGKFTGTGHFDLVTANANDSTVSVVLGRGDGSFLSIPTLQVGSGPYTVAGADFNHDGNLDLVTANYGDNTVSVLLGRGDGTFEASAPVAVGSGPWSVAVGDFNHDGNPDLVTANYHDDAVSVLLGRGDGSFLPPVVYALAKGSGPYAVAVGDFNADGILDLAVADFGPPLDANGNRPAGGDMVSVLLGNGDGTFRAGDTYSVGSGSMPYAVAVGDFNRDGHLDLVTANSGTNTVSVLLGRGDGTFKTAASFAVGSTPRSVAVGDFNNDGRLDLATANFGDNTVSVLVGDGDGSFLPAVPLPPLPTGSKPYGVAVGDFNRDGHLDLAIANSGTNTVSVLLNRGAGPEGVTFQPAVSSPVGNTSQAVAVGDFNNDGHLDLATANSGGNSVSVLLDQGRAQFQAATSENGIALRPIPYLHDFNGDGIPDSLILNSSGDLLFRRGLPGAANHFAPPVVVNPGPTRDVAVFRTTAGWAVATIPMAGDTVSISTWSAPAGSFQLSSTFATGHLPVRIAAADLNGDGLDDLVAASDFDHSVTLAFQAADGHFDISSTHPVVGMGPADIAFADLDGQNGPDVVVSDQVSGDVSVLFNDPSHSFSQQSRYRAASGQFGIAVDANTGEQSVRSQEQTLGVVAGNFTGSGRHDLVMVNRGDKRVTLLSNQGQGHLTAPQANTNLTSAQPGQIVSLTLPGDALPSVAILMEDRSEIWIYRNHQGDGTFDPPTKINAGNDPRGFSVAQVKGQLALLVGNDYGDILTLLSDGQGGFAPDRADLQNAPLAVGTVASTGQQYVVVADQKLDQVSVYYRIPGTNRFDSPLPINSQTQPLLAPGAVQMFTVPGDANPYLVVANSLSNNVLVYPSQGNGQFGAPTAYAVGFNPVSVTVTDLNGDGVPDLLVANQGSNDISVLVGAIDPQTNEWTEIPYQRLNSGSSGPITVAVRESGSSHGPDLVVTNSDGKVAQMEGIGSDGKGSGFFTPPTPLADLGSTIAQSLLDPATGQLDVVRGDGGLSALTGDHFTSLFTPTAGDGVTTLGAVGTFLVAGFEHGGVGLLSDNGTLLASEPTGFTDALSALEVLQNGNALEVYVTERGNEVPVIVSFIPVVTESSPGPAVAQGTSLPSADLVLVATLLSGGLVEHLPASTTEAVPGGEVFVVFPPPTQVEDSEPEEDIFVEMPPEVREVGEQPEVSGWESLPLGVTETLQHRLQQQQLDDSLEQIQDVLQEVLDPFKEVLKPPTAEPGSTAPDLAPETIPPVSAILANQPDQPHSAPSLEQPAPAGPVQPAAESIPLSAADGRTGPEPLTVLLAAGVYQAAWSAGPGPAQPFRGDQDSARRRTNERERR